MKEKEHQSIEWKESWQGEYLKWICGYANAYGGTIYIGTDDDGNVVGIDNARDLLGRIPNKITDTMGIIADVKLLYKGELEYLQIIVDKYPSLISFAENIIIVPEVPCVRLPERNWKELC